jgi:hypothetical protein
MGDYKTIDQITSAHPSEWVLIDEPQTDARLQLLGGRVLFHSVNRDDVYQKAAELRRPNFAIRFLGAMPENMALVL